MLRLNVPINWPIKMLEKEVTQNFRPRKSLGQHFLFDPDILKRIALSTGSIKSETVIEVGPGPGGLTRQLLNAGASPVITIEADERFARKLNEWPEITSGQLYVIHEDARKIDWNDLIAKFSPKKTAKIISNLPYNIGTILLMDWLKASDWRKDMAILLQKEVAMRICATPKNKHYGRLSVICHAVTDARIAFTLPPGAFRPPPKIDSALVVLTPLTESERYHDLPILEKVTATTFGQRRKKLKSSLSRLANTFGLTVEDLLETAGVNGDLRPEALTHLEFQKLASCLKV